MHSYTRGTTSWVKRLLGKQPGGGGGGGGGMVGGGGMSFDSFSRLGCSDKTIFYRLLFNYK